MLYGVAALLPEALAAGLVLVVALLLELPVLALPATAGAVALVPGVAVLLAGAGCAGLVVSGRAELDVVTAPLLLG